jgi:hypothetical protein
MEKSEWQILSLVAKRREYGRLSAQAFASRLKRINGSPNFKNADCSVRLMATQPKVCRLNLCDSN